MGSIHQALLGLRTAIGGGGFFDPSAYLSDLDFDLDGDAISGSDGAAVVDWPDIGPAGLGYGQNTTLQQPTLKVGLYNGHNAVRFGSNKCLVPDPTARDFGVASTLVCVCTPSSAADYIIKGSNAEGRPGFISKFNPGAGVADFEYWNKSSGSGERATFSVSATGLHILTVARTDDTGNYVGYFDDVEVFNSAVDVNRDWSTSAIAIIGAFTAGSSSYDGDIAMMLKFNANHAGTSGLSNLLGALKTHFNI